MAKLVAHLLATAALWVPIQTSLKIQKGDISKGVANTLKPAKKILQKKLWYLARGGRGEGAGIHEAGRGSLQLLQQHQGGGQVAAEKIIPRFPKVN